MPSQARHFACTSCGRCCNRGPEIELSEATALADRFVTSITFKAHSLPTSNRTEWAGEWWRHLGSRIPLRPALDEAQRHLGQFASKKLLDKRRDRHVFLEISAIVEDDGMGRCPALIDGLCSIYETRPLSCRTVPLHYSRAPSTLQAYLDGFVATAGYRCDTSASAPAVLDGNRVLDEQLLRHRRQAVELAKADRRWKDRLVGLMERADMAAAAGLPSLEAVLSNSDNGYATILPMIVAWRVARNEGLLSDAELEQVCRKQAKLIRARLAREDGDAAQKALLDLVMTYESLLSGGAIQADNSRLSGNVLR